MKSLPKGWKLNRIGGICDVQLGKMLSPKSMVGDRPVPYLRNANVQWNRFDLEDVSEMDFTEVQEAKFQLYPGDLLVCEGGEPGRAAVWEGQIARCCFQKAIHRIRPKSNEVDPWFLMHRFWLAAASGEFIDSNAKTTIAHLPAVRLRSLEIALPPLEEQKRIAKVLRDQMASVNEAKTAAENQIQTLKTLTSAELHDAFNGSHTNDWPRRLLKELTSKIGSGATPRGGAATYQTTGVPLIRSMNVHLCRFVWQGLAFISEDQECRMNNSRVIPNDVLLNITGASIGRVCIVPESICPANVNQHVCIVRCGDDLHPLFLAYFLAQPSYQKAILENQAGATRQALTKIMIENFSLFAPSIEIQDAITKRVEKRLEQIEKSTLLAKKQLTAINALPASILRQAFSGQL